MPTLPTSIDGGQCVKRIRNQYALYANTTYPLKNEFCLSERTHIKQFAFKTAQKTASKQRLQAQIALHRHTHVCARQKYAIMPQHSACQWVTITNDSHGYENPQLPGTKSARLLGVETKTREKDIRHDHYADSLIETMCKIERCMCMNNHIWESQRFAFGAQQRGVDGRGCTKSCAVNGRVKERRQTMKEWGA